MPVDGEEELFDAHAEGVGHLGQDVGARGLLALLPISDVRLGDTEGVGELDLGEAGLLAEVGEVLALPGSASDAPFGHGPMIRAVLERAGWGGKKGLHDTSILV